jgi:hypothetical protein
MGGSRAHGRHRPATREGGGEILGLDKGPPRWARAAIPPRSSAVMLLDQSSMAVSMVFAFLKCGAHRDGMKPSEAGGMATLEPFNDTELPK